MRRRLLILGMAALWVTSLLPLREARATRRDRMRVDIVDTLGKLPTEARVTLSGELARAISGGKHETTVETLERFMETPGFGRLSDGDVAGLRRIVHAAYRGARDTASMNWRERAAAAASAALDETWGRVDETIVELFRSAPNIDE